MSIIRTVLATVLVGTLMTTTALHAQSLPLTNADVIRFVSLRVSNETLIAVISESKLTQFDLSPTAISELMLKGVSNGVIASMRQSSSPTLPPTSGPQTLAGASAAAKQVTHTWELSTNTESSQTAVPGPPATTSDSTKPEGAPTSRPESTKDEAWWRSHAVALKRTLADDVTQLTAAQAYYDGLPSQARGIIGTPIVAAWMKAREEITRLAGVVVNDKRALADFEEEARRAGVIPGWLREN